MQKILLSFSIYLISWPLLALEYPKDQLPIVFPEPEIEQQILPEPREINGKCDAIQKVIQETKINKMQTEWLDDVMGSKIQLSKTYFYRWNFGPTIAVVAIRDGKVVSRKLFTFGAKKPDRSALHTFKLDQENFSESTVNSLKQRLGTPDAVTDHDTYQWRCGNTKYIFTVGPKGRISSKKIS